MTGRTFVVTVSEAPARVLVEDVRHSRHAVTDELADVGREIARLIADGDSDPATGHDEGAEHA